MKVTVLHSPEPVVINFDRDVRGPMLCWIIQFAVDEVEDRWIIPVTQTHSRRPPYVATDYTTSDLVIDEHAVERAQLFANAAVQDVSCPFQ